MDKEESNLHSCLKCLTQESDVWKNLAIVSGGDPKLAYAFGIRHNLKKGKKKYALFDISWVIGGGGSAKIYAYTWCLHACMAAYERATHLKMNPDKHLFLNYPAIFIYL